MRRLQVQSWLQASNNTGILNTCTRLWLTVSEQATPVDSIKDIVRSSVKVPEFDKLLKKARGHIGRNVVEITMKTLNDKIIKLRLRQFRKSTWNYTTLYTFLVLDQNNWIVYEAPSPLEIVCEAPSPLKYKCSMNVIPWLNWYNCVWSPLSPKI